jgi:hypothetical protein
MLRVRAEHVALAIHCQTHRSVDTGGHQARAIEAAREQLLLDHLATARVADEDILVLVHRDRCRQGQRQREALPAELAIGFSYLGIDISVDVRGIDGLSATDREPLTEQPRSTIRRR